MRLVLYSKPGCHLCEGLQEKLDQIQTLAFELEVRNIEQRPDWFSRYQYEIPVLCWVNPATGAETPLPRLSPRGSTAQLAQMLQTYAGSGKAE